MIRFFPARPDPSNQAIKQPSIRATLHAGLVVTTEALVVEKPEPKKAGGGGHGHPGMGGMDGMDY